MEGEEGSEMEQREKSSLDSLSNSDTLGASGARVVPRCAEMALGRARWLPAAETVWRAWPLGADSAPSQLGQ